MPALSINESQLFTVLRSFLLGILPSTVEVIRGQDNRVGEPKGTDFVVMTPALRTRLATNVDSTTNNAFTASISGATMTVTAVAAGSIVVGNQVFGPNVAPNTVIKSKGTGTGGVGTYMLTVPQTVASQPLTAGTANAQQSTQVSVQLDVHGTASADNAQVISTLFWDQYAFSQITSQGFDIAPLYCTDPQQIPFLNAEQQYENRWVIDVLLQVNPVVQTPIQVANLLGPVDVIDVI